MEITDVNQSPLEQALGELLTKQVMAPDGEVYTLRETTGADEDLLSRMRHDGSMEPMYQFLSRVIVSPKLNTSAVKKLKARVKWYLVLKSRILSLGEELTFKYRFQGDEHDSDIEENLAQFDFDYEHDTWTPESKAPQPYPDNETHYSFKLSSGLDCRFEYLTGLHEENALKKLKTAPKSLTINHELIIRNFAIMDGNGDWIPVVEFSKFSSRVMRELRAELDKYDKEWAGIMDVESPTGTIDNVSIFQLEDFFFPRA